MIESDHQLVTSRIDNGVLIFTLQEPHLRSDKMADGLRAEMLKILNQTALKKVVVDMQAVQSLSAKRSVGPKTRREQPPRPSMP